MTAYFKNIAFAMAIISGLCVIYTYSAETKEDAARKAQEALDAELMDATRSLDLARVKQALAQGANANQDGIICMLSLHPDSREPDKILKNGMTVRNSKSAIITELIKHGTHDVTYETLTTNITYSPKDPYILEAYVNAGGNIQLKSSIGKTLLMAAVNASSIIAFDLLLYNGADLNAKDDEGHDVMYYIDRGWGWEPQDLMRQHIKEYKEIQSAAKEGQSATGNPLMKTVADYLGTGE